MEHKNLTDEQYGAQLKQIRAENKNKRRLAKLEKEKHKYDKKHTETSKIIAVYLFILLNAIILYAMFMMWRFGDLSCLSILVSDIAAQVIIYGIYCMKAFNGKKQEELIKFNREQLFINNHSAINTEPHDDGARG